MEARPGVGSREFRDLGDGLIAIGRTRTRGRTSGVETETPLALVTEIRKGKTSSIRAYLDPEEALIAAGWRSSALDEKRLDPREQSCSRGYHRTPS